jgi:hypothetical protein
MFFLNIFYKIRILTFVGLRLERNPLAFIGILTILKDSKKTFDIFAKSI